MPLPAAALAAVISALGTTVSNIALSNKQKQYNEQMQDKMNLYNSPSEQIERLKAAGISPNSLTMGNGSVVAGNHSASLNPYQLPNIQDPMSMITNSMLTGAKTKSEDEMRELRKQEVAAQIQTLQANAEKLGVDTQYQSILNVYASAKEMAAIKGQFATNALSWAQVNHVRQDAKNLAYQLSELLPAELKKLVSETNLNVGQLDLLIEQIAKTHAETANVQQSTAESEAREELLIAQSAQQEHETSRYDELTDAILEQYQATVNKLASETGLTQQQAFYYLFEICNKYGIKFMGVPIPGHGGVRNVDLNKQVLDNAIDQYGASSFYGNK